jgi:hypothetical protein
MASSENYIVHRPQACGHLFCSLITDTRGEAAFRTKKLLDAAVICVANEQSRSFPVIDAVIDDLINQLRNFLFQHRLRAVLRAIVHNNDFLFLNGAARTA